jgi:hypothetical protein
LESLAVGEFRAEVELQVVFKFRAEEGFRAFLKKKVVEEFRVVVGGQEVSECSFQAEEGYSTIIYLLQFCSEKAEGGSYFVGFGVKEIGFRCHLFSEVRELMEL